MAELARTGLWRTLAFVTVYGLSVVAVTAVFWQANRPSADTVTPLTTTSPAPSTSSSSAPSPDTSGGLPAALSVSANLTANDAYGITGSAAFVNASTILVKALSFNGTGPKVQLELRDRQDSALAVVKDLTKLTLSSEDLVIAVPSTVDISQVNSLAIVAPDFKLVLSRAAWR